MKHMSLYKEFEKGRLELSTKTINFKSIEWSEHSSFKGVELKNIITGEDTNNEFSYHLLKINSNKEIELHIHEKQLEAHEVISGYGHAVNNGKIIDYYPGVISVFDKGSEHKVIAGKKGLYIFAKFIPALC